jgi:uncharacterized membrane protein
MRSRFVSCGALIVAAVLSACAGASPRRPALEVRTVATPVAVACAPDLGGAPAYPDTDAALRSAPNLFARVRLLVAGRLLRMARERELGAALAACGTEPRP